MLIDIKARSFREKQSATGQACLKESMYLLGRSFGGKPHVWLLCVGNPLYRACCKTEQRPFGRVEGPLASCARANMQGHFGSTRYWPKRAMGILYLGETYGLALKGKQTCVQPSGSLFFSPFGSGELSSKAFSRPSEIGQPKRVGVFRFRGPLLLPSLSYTLKMKAPRSIPSEMVGGHRGQNVGGSTQLTNPQQFFCFYIGSFHVPLTPSKLVGQKFPC